MSESNYKLRKKIKELESEVCRLRDYRLVVLEIFDMLCGLKENEYFRPSQIIKTIRRLL